jgi:hypothetical protein
MKKIIAIAIAATLATPAFAFFDDGNSNGTFINNGKADVVGNATGEGEATFGMTFEGTGSTAGKFSGNGTNNGNFVGRGDDNRDTASATGYADNAVATRGNGDAAGSAKFAMNFSARAKGNGDFKGNGNLDSNNNVYGTGYSTPYYGQRPYAFPAQ